MKEIPEERLLVFVKAPRSGQVKTRLAGALGDETACLAYRCLVESLTRTLSPLRNVDLVFSPEDAAVEIQGWKRDAWRCVPQTDGDLGRRMSAAFQAAFDEGCKRVVCIGSDCPDLTVEEIQNAWRSLQTHDAVLGPARDGGYWLIGLSAPRPELFRGIAWSAPDVCEQTVRILNAAGLRWKSLAVREDVDTAEDWNRLLQRNAKIKSHFLGMKS